MKKYIDLHIHLDGAVTLDIAKKLAKLQNIELPASNDKELEKMLQVPETCANLNDFLSCFALPVSLMQTYEGLKEAAYSVAEKMASQGVVYGEIRYAPQLHTTKLMTQEDAINAVLEGVGKSKLKANIILCLMRGDGNESENLETVNLAKKYLVSDGGVVALDLAGAEALFPTAKYKNIFAKVKEYNIPFTIHAGEADGAQSIALAIEYGASRIGHGVRAFEDPKVLQSIIDNGIPLEMCPTSNRQTLAVADMSSYPFMDYLNRGVKVTLNTDDPGIEGTEIGKEFLYMEKTFGLNEEQKRKVLQNSIDAAFTTNQVKAELRKILDI